jgi:pyruvate-formate lyase-activating enzyme
MDSDELKICPFPFSRIEYGHIHKEFVPCCYAWFLPNYKDEFLNEKKSHQNLWNSEQAIKLRESILDGSYRYCNIARCNKPVLSLAEIKKMDPDYFETPITPNNILAIKQGNPIMPDGPSSISMNADYKCNLKCPTCRNDYKIESNEAPQEKLLILEELKNIWAARKTLEVIKMSNNGEVFFSKDQRDLLKRISKENFPNLKHIFIITNGLFLNEKSFQELQPGTSYIKKVAVSMDAGNEKAYRLTRGGNWRILLDNLNWISKKRENLEFNTFNLNFVIRKDNYESIDDFIRIGRNLGVDRFEFTKYDDWNAMYGTPLDLSKRYFEQAVHLKDNPSYSKLVSILDKYRGDKDIALNIDGV